MTKKFIIVSVLISDTLNYSNKNHDSIFLNFLSIIYLKKFYMSTWYKLWLTNFKYQCLNEKSD